MFDLTTETKESKESYTIHPYLYPQLKKETKAILIRPHYSLHDYCLALIIPLVHRGNDSCTHPQLEADDGDACTSSSVSSSDLC